MESPSSHPYREPRPSEADPVATASFESRLVGLVLFLSGLLGVLVGLPSPADHALELVVGAALVILGLVTLRSAIVPSMRTRFVRRKTP